MHLSSASVNFYVRDNFIRFTTPHDFGSGEFFYQITETLQNSLVNMNNKNRIGSAFFAFFSVKNDEKAGTGCGWLEKMQQHEYNKNICIEHL